MVLDTNYVPMTSKSIPSAQGSLPDPRLIYPTSYLPSTLEYQIDILNPNVSKSELLILLPILALTTIFQYQLMATPSYQLFKTTVESSMTPILLSHSAFCQFKKLYYQLHLQNIFSILLFLISSTTTTLRDATIICQLKYCKMFLHFSSCPYRILFLPHRILLTQQPQFLPNVSSYYSSVQNRQWCPFHSGLKPTALRLSKGHLIWSSLIFLSPFPILIPLTNPTQPHLCPSNMAGILSPSGLYTSFSERFFLFCGQIHHLFQNYLFNQVYTNH